MRRPASIGIYICILAIWAQIFAPVAAMSTERAVDPFSVICSHAPANAGHAPTDHRHHDHQHCLLCQAHLGGPTLDHRPAFTALDYPIASPLRWALSDVAPRAAGPYGTAQPRGPPALV